MLNKQTGLVYTGKITELEPIPGADFILSATVICGTGGIWRGVVRKADFTIGALCTVYLPDALVPPCAELFFLKSSNWRIKMQRYRGAPSEVLIRPIHIPNTEIGFDCTEIVGATRYYKPIPANLAGVSIGPFPQFLPKTDEPNYQSVPELVEALQDKPFYITEKADGSSTTAYRHKGKFSVCSRNWELAYDNNNGYWKVANKYQLQSKLPEGIALQWETCGPGIQCNTMRLRNIDGFAFSAFNIETQTYLELTELMKLIDILKFPFCKIVSSGLKFDSSKVSALGEGTYDSGHPREGVVVRSTTNLLGFEPISFKVINLGYEK